jgi:hypothetical protein
MPRIRTIKPEFWSNEKLASLSFQARLLAIALLNYSDDEGFFKANEKLVRAFAFPLDEPASIKIPVLLRELSGIGYVGLRELSGSAPEQRVEVKITGCILGFRAHQRINKPSSSSLRAVWEASGSATVGLPEDYAREGKGKEGKGRERKYPDDFECFWNLYPKDRRVEKGNALKSWKALSPESQALALAGGARLQAAFLNADSQFLPYPERWLKNARWEDPDAELARLAGKNGSGNGPRIVIHKNQSDIDREREGNEIQRNREAATIARDRREAEENGFEPPDTTEERAESERLCKVREAQLAAGKP